MAVRGCHKRHRRLLGHRDLARVTDRRICPACPAWMVGSAPICDLIFFNSRCSTSVTTSPTKAAEEAERESCKEQKADDHYDRDDDVEIVVVSGGCSGGSC